MDPSETKLGQDAARDAAMQEALRARDGAVAKHAQLHDATTDAASELRRIAETLERVSRVP